MQQGPAALLSHAPSPHGPHRAVGTHHSTLVQRRPRHPHSGDSEDARSLRPRAHTLAKSTLHTSGAAVPNSTAQARPRANAHHTRPPSPNRALHCATHDVDEPHHKQERQAQQHMGHGPTHTTLHLHVQTLSGMNTRQSCKPVRQTTGARADACGKGTAVHRRARALHSGWAMPPHAPAAQTQGRPVTHRARRARLRARAGLPCAAPCTARSNTYAYTHAENSTPQRRETKAVSNAADPT